MKVLITGAAGFIGLSVAKRLAEIGADVHMVDVQKPSSVDKEFYEVLKKPNVEFFTLNGLDENAIKILDRNYTHIAHFAALLGVQNVLDAPSDVLECNQRLTSNFLMLAKCQKSRPRFVFASTSEVYAGTQAAGLLAIPSPETSQIILPSTSQPRTSYMLSKIYGEAMCALSGVPYTIVRPHNIYGPRMGMRHVVPQLLQRAYQGTQSELVVFSPYHTRTFCYIDDAVDLLVLLMSSEGALNETFNLGNQLPEITMKNLAEIIIDEIGKPKTIKTAENTTGSPCRRAPDMTKCFEVVGSREMIPVTEGIKKTFKWYRENWFQK